MAARSALTPSAAQRAIRGTRRSSASPSATRTVARETASSSNEGDRPLNTLRITGSRKDAGRNLLFEVQNLRAAGVGPRLMRGSLLQLVDHFVHRVQRLLDLAQVADRGGRQG